MTLLQVRTILIKYKVIFVLTVVASTLAAATLTILQPRVFEATSKIYVSVPTTDNATQLSQGGTYAQQVVIGLAEVVKTPAVLSAVASRLGQRRYSEEKLSDSVDAAVPDNTPLISLTARASTANDAAEIATLTATSLVRAASSLTRQSDGAASVQMHIVERAAVPSSPIQPRPLVNLLVGLLIGLLLGLVVALLRSALDTRLRSPSDFTQAFQLPVLGAIPYDAGWSPGLIELPNFQAGDPSSVAERYRSALIALTYAQSRENQPRSLAVTSSRAGEGKTSTSLALSLLEAERGRRVLLIDADLRRPTLHDVAGVINEPGLSDVIAGFAEAEQAIQSWRPKIDILPAGRIPPNPLVLLQSSVFRALVADFSERYDLVVIDTPPTVVDDALVIGQVVEALLLAVSAREATRPGVSELVSKVANVNAVVCGVLLTKVKQPNRRPSEYGYAPQLRTGEFEGVADV